MFEFLTTKRNKQRWDPLHSLQGKEPQKPTFGWLGFLLDAFLVLTGAAFVVFAGMAMASDGQPLTEGSRAQYLLDITFYGPTIFPIIFAAIVGRALKALATWELQRGSTIGHVEALSGSTTLMGALITQIQLRNLNLVAIALVLLWILSPVGGQASLRILRSGTRVLNTEHQVHILDTSSRSFGGNETLMRLLFTSSLVTTKMLQNKPQDIWGNLRIPMVEALDDYQDHAWIKVPTDGSNVTFSSFVGIPFSPTLPDEPTSFTFNTSYMYLDCPTSRSIPKKDGLVPWTNFTDNPPQLENPNNSWWHSSASIGGNPNGTPEVNGFQIGLSSCLWGCNQTLEPGKSPEPREARRFILESASRKNLSHIECNLHTTYVDVRYNCVNASCVPNEVRLSPNIPGPEYFYNPTEPGINPRDPWNDRNFTGFDRGDDSTPRLLYALTSAYDVLENPNTIPVLGFLLSSNDPLARPPTFPFYGDVSSLERAKLQERLSQLINSLYISGIRSGVIVHSIPITANNNTAFEAVTITAESRKTEKIVVCSKAWFGIMLVICIIVLVISLFGAILRAITLVPDVLGTLSIVTLDNRSEKELQKGSMLDGLERSRLLSSVSIKLGNVKQNSPQGRVAFAAPAHDEDVIELRESGLYE